MLASQSPINERGEVSRADGGDEMFSISEVQGRGDDRAAQKKDGGCYASASSGKTSQMRRGPIGGMDGGGALEKHPG